MLSLLAPKRCLVCESPCRIDTLCRRCRAPARDLPNAESRCVRCFHPLQSKINVCQPCQNLPSPFTMQRYIWEYLPPARDLIVAMKYRPSRVLTRKCAAILIEHFDNLFPFQPKWDLIIPMPSSLINYRRRLFNPSREICRALSAHLGVAYRADIISHRNYRAAQASQPERQRHSNAKRSLVLQRQPPAGRSVLLFDDVVTTGATSRYAAQLLLSSGAARVDLISLARAPRWHLMRRMR